MIFMERYILIIGVFITMLLCSVSCEKSQYTDTGTFQNNFSGTSMDYLRTRPELFDSLTKIIELAGMEEDVNKNNTTFFVPSNYTIIKSVQRLNSILYSFGRDTIINLNEVNPLTWKEFLSYYIFEDKKLLNDYPQLDTNKMDVFPGQGYISIGNKNMNIGVVYHDVSNQRDGVWQTVQYAGYRQLFFSSVDITNQFGRMVNVPVSTSDLKTKNGVLHVLNFSKHTFGFTSQFFVERAYSMLN